MTLQIPMSARLVALILAFAGVVALAGPRPATASEVVDLHGASAQSFVGSLAAQAVDTLTDADLPAVEREARFRAFLTDRFDVPLVARFALGRHWRMASEAERATFTDLFEDLLVVTYGRRFGGYAGESFAVTGVAEAGRRDVQVHSLVTPLDGPPVDVAWRVRPQEGGGYRVIDVAVAGVSLAITQRSEFAAIVQRHGGQVSALIAALEERLSPQQLAAR